MRVSALALAVAISTTSTPLLALGLDLSGFAETGPQVLGYGAKLTLTVPLDRWFAGTSASAGAGLGLAANEADGEAAVGEAAVGQASAGAAPSSEARAPEVAELWDASGQQHFFAELPAEWNDSGPLVFAQDAAPREPSEARSESSGEPRSESRSESPGEPAPPAGAPRKPPWQLEPALILGIVEAALQRQLQGERRLDSLGSRARSSAWLPEVRIGAGRNIDQTLRLSPTAEDPNRWQLTGGADLRLEAHLSWEFARLLFASEELPVERLRQSAEQQRLRLTMDVLEWVFRWQRAELDAHDRTIEPERRALARLLAGQARAALDALTSGWFGRRVRDPDAPGQAR